MAVKLLVMAVLMTMTTVMEPLLHVLDVFASWGRTKEHHLPAAIICNSMSISVCHMYGKKHLRAKTPTLWGYSYSW